LFFQFLAIVGDNPPIYPCMIRRQRMALRKGTLEAEKKKRLDDIGFVWDAGINGSGSDELREYEHQHQQQQLNNAKNEHLSHGVIFSNTPGDENHEHVEGAVKESAERACDVAAEERGIREERRDRVARRGRLKLDEARSFDDWCELLKQVRQCRFLAGIDTAGLTLVHNRTV